MTQQAILWQVQDGCCTSSQQLVASSMERHFMRLLRCDYVVGRLLIYGVFWLVAVLAFQVFLQPEGLTETSLSEIQQRIFWPLETPLMAVLGLAQFFTWPAFPNDTAFLSSILCFVLLGIVIPFCADRKVFITLVWLHAIILTTAIIYFIRQWHLPSGP